LAVSWTDTVQATLMIFALLLTPVIVMLHAGGFDEAVQVINSLDVKYSDMFHGTTTIGIISLMAWGLGYMGQPHILARFMAASSAETIPNARRIGMCWMVVTLAGAVAVGYFGIAYFSAYPEQAGAVQANHETVFISLSQLLFNPWIAGILLSAILAAVMSTLSCQLLVSSSALTEDFYKVFFRPQASQKELVWVGRLMVLLVAVIAIVIAGDPTSKVLGLVGYAWAGFGSAFGPVVLLSVIWPRMTRNGALAGMLIGALTVIVWRNGGWFGLYEMVPGFLLATVAIILFSLMDKAPSLRMQQDFALMKAEMAGTRDLSAAPLTE
ncbi:MAG: sodium/solute symporter, partial [Tolumonas sp.]